MKNIEYTNDVCTENYYDDKCPILYALKIVGQKWKLPILWHLMDKDVMHYNDLKYSIKGI